MSNYQLLGADTAVEVAAPETYHPDELKEIFAKVALQTTTSTDSQEWFKQGSKYMPGGSNYFLAPYNWIDLPRNPLENKGTWRYGTYDTKNWDDGKFGYTNVTHYYVIWEGRAFYFHSPEKYINGLKTIFTPADYIKYLKLAPLAGFNVTNTKAAKSAYRGYFNQPAGRSAHYDAAYNGDYAPVLPADATGLWWKEVITYHLMQHSFFQLRAAQIEDRTDLENVYMNSGKLIDSLKADMRTEEPVDVQAVTHGTGSTKPGFRIVLKLEEWQIKALESGLAEVRRLIDESRKKMAMRIIELSDVDAKIVPTSFSTDPLSNPYLVYNQEKSAAAGRPIFTNVARNSASTWAPPEVAGDPANMKYWEQVPEYEKEHERVYATAEGPMSESDIRKYGLDGAKRTNWLPWIAAGAAAAFAAYQLKG